MKSKKPVINVAHIWCSFGNENLKIYKKNHELFRIK